MDRKLASALIGIVIAERHPGSERCRRHRPSRPTTTEQKNIPYTTRANANVPLVRSMIARTV